jgi:lysophospholipase L1-like esterase
MNNIITLCLLMAMAAAPDDKPTIVAFGDSITATRGELRIYAAVLADELHADIINRGIGGHTTKMGRDRFDRDVLTHDPDVAIILFGANDAAVDVWKDPPATEPRVSLEDYETNLRHFCRTLRERDVRVLLVTPPPFRWTDRMREMYGKPPYDPDDPDGFSVVLIDYAAVVRKVAAEEGATLVDAWAAFEAYDAEEDQSMDELFLDGMHPNERGQKIIAELLLDVLR